MTTLLSSAAFGLAAFFYAMVGHGGASAYLALGSFLGQAPGALRSQALLLNLGVAGLAAFSYARVGYLRWRLILPLGAASVPAAFLAARVAVSLPWAQALLALALAAAGLRLLGQTWLQAMAEARGPRQASLPGLVAVGLCLGALAGLTGVGGGIYLSPLLLLLGWADIKETAACSALFIVVNSLAGLGGLLSQGQSLQVPPAWLASTLVCGAAGAWLGAGWMPSRRLAQVLAGVLLVAAVKLGMQALA